MFQIFTCPNCNSTAGLLQVAKAFGVEEDVSDVECSQCGRVFSAKQSLAKAAPIANTQPADELGANVMSLAIVRDQSRRMLQPYRLQERVAGQPRVALAHAPVLLPMPAKVPALSDVRMDSEVAESESSQMVANHATGVLEVTNLEMPTFMNIPVQPIVGGRWKVGFLGLLPVLLLLLFYALWADSRRLASAPLGSVVIPAFCRIAGCDLRPIPEPKAFAIGASSFVESDRGDLNFEFSVVNTSARHLAVPGVVIYLTDSKDRVLATQMVIPAQLASEKVVRAGASIAAKVKVEVPAAVKPLINGYHVQISDDVIEH